MDIAEYKKVVIAMRPTLLNIANCITHNNDDAEDVVQDVCLKLWHKCLESDVPDNIEAYCITMTKYRSIDKLRARQPESELEEVSHTEAIAQLPDELLEVKEVKALIHRIISFLPALQKQIIQLKDIEGYDTDEIVEITGITAEAVRNNLSRARKRLRDLLLESQRNTSEKFCKTQDERIN